MHSVYQEFSNTTQRAEDKPFLHIPHIAAKTYTDTAVDLSYGQALEIETGLKLQ